MAALDSTVLLALMIAGAIFCAAGLSLIFFRKKPETGAAKFELFGQKLEANSTGILVFLVGAAFLASPLYVPQRETEKKPAVAPASTPKTSDGSTAPAIAGETEDNNAAEKANELALGSTVGGYLGSDDEDWFAVDSGQGAGKEIKVTLRALHDGCTRYELFGSDKSLIGNSMSCSRGADSNSYQVPQGISYMRVEPYGSPGNYELSVATK